MTGRGKNRCPGMLLDRVTVKSTICCGIALLPILSGASLCGDRQGRPAILPRRRLFELLGNLDDHLVRAGRSDELDADRPAIVARPGRDTHPGVAHSVDPAAEHPLRARRDWLAVDLGRMLSLDRPSRNRVHG